MHAASPVTACTAIVAAAICAMSLLAAPAIADGEGGGCQRRATAVLPLLNIGGGYDVLLSIGGHDVRFLVDTGGMYSMVSDSNVDRLGLTRLSLPPGGFQSFGGQVIASHTIGHEVHIGNLRVANMELLIMADEPGFDGTLAPDVLTHFDADFDFENGRLNLFPSGQCSGDPVYWTHDAYSTLPFVLVEGAHIEAKVKVDGQEFPALVDTGATHSVLSLQLAQKVFGFTSTDPRLKRNGTRVSRPSFSFPFGTLVVGGIAFDNPDIDLIADDHAKMSSHRSMILGLGILRQLHLYVAYDDRKLYFTRLAPH